MADLGAGRSTPRHNSNVSLGLVGVPRVQDSVQHADKFEFEVNPKIDLNSELDATIDAHIDAFHANSRFPDRQSLKSIQIRPDSSLKTDIEPAELCQAYVSSEQYPPNTYDLKGLELFPAQHNFTYPEPQIYTLTHALPYFNNDYGAVGSSGGTFGTLGLAATPGNIGLVERENAQYLSHSHAKSTESWMLPTEVASLPTLHRGYIPDEHPPVDTSVQFAFYPEGPRAATTSSFSVGPIPSSLVNKGTDEVLFETDSDSDKDHRDTNVRTTKTSKRRSQNQLRKESVSSVNTSAATSAEPVKYLPGEKPQKVDAKPWIRTNASTEGDTRTAKINNWKNYYEYKPLPLGAWSSGKHTFKYTQYENVDFLTEAPMSTRKIKEYIMNYPRDDQKCLVLWIQKMPADQGRRYGSKQHSKCAFRDCPMQRYVEGTISTGEYRVAFDEKGYTYGNRVDPYDCAAYAHLYCMEQFLDFEQVCQVADVRIDTRIDMPLEPNGKAAFSMADVPARYEMERFVKAASKGKLRQTKRWNNYPIHTDYDRNQQKPHERTLTYLAHCMYEAHQDDSHKKQAALRRVTVSQRRVHLGDLEMSVADKRIMIEVYGGKKKGRHAKIEEHYDERILYHIARAKQEAMNFLESKCQGKNSVIKSKKRKLAEHGESDWEQSINEPPNDTQPRTPRASRPKKQRVHYAEPPVVTQQPYAQASYLQPQQLLLAPNCEQQVQHIQSYLATDLDDSSETTQAPHPVDPTLDTPYGLYTVPATPKFDISDFSNFPTCGDNLPDDSLEKLLTLERRQSCAAEFGPASISKSPTVTHGGRTPRSANHTRRAVFETQPVSRSKEYRANDPPSLMTGRRSARLAEKEKLGE